MVGASVIKLDYKSGKLSTLSTSTSVKRDGARSLDLPLFIVGPMSWILYHAGTGSRSDQATESPLGTVPTVVLPQWSVRAGICERALFDRGEDLAAQWRSGSLQVMAVAV